MFKSFLISMFAILLFTLGGAAAWFYVQMVEEESPDEDSIVQPLQAVGGEADPVPRLDVLGNGGVLPAVVRGPALDADEMFRLSTATKAKQQQLLEYDEQLREHKRRIKAADADTKTAQREVEGTLKEIRNLMDATESLLSETQQTIAELQKERIETQRKTDDLKKVEGEAGAGVKRDVKNFAEYLQSMPPEDAAQTIKEMTNDGKMDFAIQLLRNIEVRNVSKILAEIKDPALVAELATRYPEVPQLR